MSISKMLDLVKEIQNISMFREHRIFFIDQLTFADKKISDLKKENSDLMAELQKARIKLAAYAESEKFFKYRGALWRRDISGSYEAVVYCPKCKQSTGSFPPGEGQFNCCSCKWFSDFEAHDLPLIVKDLNSL